MTKIKPQSFYLFILLLTTTYCYHIHHVTSSSGLLYSHLGQAKLTNQKFTLLTFLNLTHANLQINSLQNLYQKSMMICSKVKMDYRNFHCWNQLQYIETKLKTIKNDYAIVTHQVNHSRLRRGLVNFVGDGFKWLFGTPDASDAQFYTDSIKSLMNNQKQTETLMQQQVRIISSTITNFNDSLMTLNRNTKTLNENIHKFDTFMTQTSDNEQALSIENRLVNHIISLVEMSDEISANLKSYVYTITLINKGIVSYEILKPQDLFNELQHVNKRYTLPLDLTLESTYTYYKLMEVGSYIKDGLLIISLKIPIVNALFYDLYEVHSLLTPHKNDPNLFSYIEPTSPYILISVTRTVYSNLNNLEDCQEFYPSQWICKEVSVARRIDHPSCEMQLFSKSTTSIPKTCQIKHLYAEVEIWHKLGLNQWIFVVSKPTTLNILCLNHTNHEEVITNMGILYLDSGCKAYSDYAILETSMDLNTVNISSKIPTTDITDDDCCRELKNNLTFKNIQLQPITLTNLDLKELKYAQHKLSQLDEVLQEQLNKPFVVKHSSWIATAITTIIGILATFAVYKIIKWCGLVSLIRRYLCCFPGLEDQGKTTSCCIPCIKIYNQSHNSRDDRPIPVVQYNTELELLNYPDHEGTPISSSRPVGRRSVRSIEGSQRSRDSTQIKINNV